MKNTLSKNLQAVEKTEAYYCFKTKKTAHMIRKFKHFDDEFYVIWHEGDEPTKTYIYSKFNFKKKYSKQTRDVKGRFSYRLKN